jgi:phosphatidylglycerophosphate synthase
MTESHNAIDPADPTLNGPKTAILVNRSSVRLWNLTQEERLRRTLARSGIDDLRTESDPLPAAGHPVILVRTDFAIDDNLLPALVREPDCMLVSPVADRGQAVVAAHARSDRAPQVIDLLRQLQSTREDIAAAALGVVSPAQLGASYNQALRKRMAPFAMSLIDNPPIAAERQMFHASYKGVTDFVTKWLWPWPAFWATRWCAARGISPNLVTGASLVLVLAAMWLFARNYFVLGLIVAWLMTFLDTVDGKLARVTLTSSKIGNIFDHGIDLVHPPFWYVAWYFGLAADASEGQTLLLAGAVWTTVIGYVIGRLQEGFFLWRYRIELHAWRPIDSAFRLFTARRNPNLAIMTAAVIAGRPDVGLIAVAVWTIVCLMFHFLRIGQAIQRQRAGTRIESWLAEPTPGS